MKCILCSYCREKMRFTTTEVERPVPAGAQDLGIVDEIDCWKCPKCNLVETDHFVECGCGGTMLDCYDSQAYDFTTTDDSGLFGYFHKASWVASSRSAPDYEGSVGNICYEDLKCIACKEDIFYDEKAIAGEWFLRAEGNDVHGCDYFHLDCYSALEEEREHERDKQIRGERTKKGLCVECGKALGFLDSVSGRKEHKIC